MNDMFHIFLIVVKQDQILYGIGILSLKRQTIRVLHKHYSFQF